MTDQVLNLKTQQHRISEVELARIGKPDGGLLRITSFYVDGEPTGIAMNEVRANGNVPLSRFFVTSEGQFDTLDEAFVAQGWTLLL